MIDQVFNTNRVEGSDLGVMSVTAEVNHEQKLEILTQFNKNIEKILKRTVASFGDPVDTITGEPKTPFIFQVLSNKSLQLISRYMLAATLREDQDTVFAETLEIIHPSGAFVRCYCILLTSYIDPNDDTKGLTMTFVLKPCSLTFDPDVFIN
jgi:hypothetical protein